MDLQKSYVNHCLPGLDFRWYVEKVKERTIRAVKSENEGKRNGFDERSLNEEKHSRL